MSVIRSRFATLILALLATVLSASAKAVILPWFDGAANFQIGTDYACLSDPPIFEARVAGYSGYTYTPPELSNIPFAQLPAVGELFYAKVVLSHPGNPCFGSAVGLEILLPAGVAPAISTANPVFCFARVPPNNNHNDYKLYDLRYDSSYGCPTSLPLGLQGLAIRAPLNTAAGGAWAMFQGSWLEIMVPLRSTFAQNGTNQIYFRVNPDIGVVGYTNVPLYVNSDTIFRSPMEDNNLTLDLCDPAIGTVATGCP